MIQHEPFNNELAELHRFRMGCGYNHSVLGIDHAAHLNAPEFLVQHFDGAHPACPDRTENPVVAESGNHNAELFRRFDDLGPLRNFNFSIVDD
jgi:hypothetical protein